MSYKKVKYPKEFIEAVKKEFPNNDMILDTLEMGHPFLSKLLQSHRAQDLYEQCAKIIEGQSDEEKHYN